jgi:hypothetical protein
VGVSRGEQIEKFVFQVLRINPIVYLVKFFQSSLAAPGQNLLFVLTQGRMPQTSILFSSSVFTRELYLS